MSDEPAEIGVRHPEGHDGYLRLAVHPGGVQYREDTESWVVEAEAVIGDAPEFLDEYDEVHLPREHVTHVSHEKL